MTALLPRAQALGRRPRAHTIRATKATITSRRNTGNVVTPPRPGIASTCDGVGEGGEPVGVDDPAAGVLVRVLVGVDEIAGVLVGVDVWVGVEVVVGVDVCVGVAVVVGVVVGVDVRVGVGVSVGVDVGWGRRFGRRRCQGRRRRIARENDAGWPDGHHRREDRRTQPPLPEETSSCRSPHLRHRECA